MMADDRSIKHIKNIFHLDDSPSRDRQRNPYKRILMRHLRFIDKFIDESRAQDLMQDRYSGLIQGLKMSRDMLIAEMLKPADKNLKTTLEKYLKKYEGESNDTEE
jgi:hypothetical protein